MSKLAYTNHVSLPPTSTLKKKEALFPSQDITFFELMAVMRNGTDVPGPVVTLPFHFIIVRDVSRVGNLLSSSEKALITREAT